MSIILVLGWVSGSLSPYCSIRFPCVVVNSMDDLAQSWKKLSLFEEEGRKVDLSRNKKVGSFVLAAKFLTRMANKE